MFFKQVQFSLCLSSYYLNSFYLILRSFHLCSPYYNSWSYHGQIHCYRFCKSLISLYFIRRCGLIKFSPQMQKQVSRIKIDHNPRFSSNHDHRVNDQMWLNGLVYQQLSLRFCQINRSLNVANATCTHR